MFVSKDWDSGMNMVTLPGNLGNFGAAPWDLIHHSIGHQGTPSRLTTLLCSRWGYWPAIHPLHVPGSTTAGPLAATGCSGSMVKSQTPYWAYWVYWVPGLVNIQKAIENGHRNSGFVPLKW